MYTIRKKFNFSAAHHLIGLAESHPCARQHGHNYEVEIVLRAEKTNVSGFVVDYRDLDAFKRMLDNALDHRDLNEVVDFQTTAENLARYFYHWCLNRWPETLMVRVSETPKTWAEFGYAL